MPASNKPPHIYKNDFLGGGLFEGGGGLFERGGLFEDLRYV